MRLIKIELDDNSRLSTGGRRRGAAVAAAAVAAAAAAAAEAQAPGTRMRRRRRLSEVVEREHECWINDLSQCATRSCEYLRQWWGQANWVFGGGGVRERERERERERGGGGEDDMENK